MNTIKVGETLPNTMIKENLIHTLLSSTHWTLIVCGKEKIKIRDSKMKILHVPENTYPSRYILIRPDWHIAIADNNTDSVMSVLNHK